MQHINQKQQQQLWAFHRTRAISESRTRTRSTTKSKARIRSRTKRTTRVTPDCLFTTTSIVVVVVVLLLSVILSLGQVKGVQITRMHIPRYVELRPVPSSSAFTSPASAWSMGAASVQQQQQRSSWWQQQATSSLSSLTREMSSSSSFLLDCEYQYEPRDDVRLTVRWFYNNDIEPFYQWLPELGIRRFTDWAKPYVDEHYAVPYSSTHQAVTNIPASHGSFTSAPAPSQAHHTNSNSSSSSIGANIQLRPQMQQSSSNNDARDRHRKIFEQFEQYRAVKFTSVNVNLSGIYSCVVSSLAGQDSRQSNLNVYVPPRTFTLKQWPLTQSFESGLHSDSDSFSDRLHQHQHKQQPQLQQQQQQQLQQSSATDILHLQSKLQQQLKPIYNHDGKRIDRQHLQQQQQQQQQQQPSLWRPHTTTPVVANNVSTHWRPLTTSSTPTFTWTSTGSVLDDSADAKNFHSLAPITTDSNHKANHRRSVDRQELNLFSVQCHAECVYPRPVLMLLAQSGSSGAGAASPGAAEIVSRNLNVTVRACSLYDSEQQNRNLAATTSGFNGGPVANTRPVVYYDIKLTAVIAVVAINSSPPPSSLQPPALASNTTSSARSSSAHQSSARDNATLYPNYHVPEQQYHVLSVDHQHPVTLECRLELTGTEYERRLSQELAINDILMLRNSNTRGRSDSDYSDSHNNSIQSSASSSSFSASGNGATALLTASKHGVLDYYCDILVWLTLIVIINSVQTAFRM